MLAKRKEIDMDIINLHLGKIQESVVQFKQSDN